LGFLPDFKLSKNSKGFNNVFCKPRKKNERRRSNAGLAPAHVPAPRPRHGPIGRRHVVKPPTRANMMVVMVMMVMAMMAMRVMVVMVMMMMGW
jgi:hypothetical protein